MIAISRVFTKRISRDFSSLSASCPDVAEKRTKGRMKIPAIRFTTSFGSSVVSRAA